MHFHRIKAILYRHLYPLRRDFDILSDMIYWPMIDVALWGITGSWLSEGTGVTNALISLMTGLILWNIMWRSQSEVGRNLIDEIWNNNLTNLFSTPLTLVEWVAGVVLLSFIKVSITLSMLTSIIFLLYKVNITQFGWWLLPFFASAVCTGWWVGFLSASVVIRHGQKMQTVVWTFPGILLPFSAVFYPLERLPEILQPISLLIPTTYILESMRSLVDTGSLNINYIFTSFGLNAFYLFLSIMVFKKSFEHSKKLGLHRFG